MQNIDLHMHSVYSDGTYTPAQLVTYAKKKGLSALSLTDHDTIDGLDEARRQSEILDIRFINGVEINSFYYLNNRKINIHVLGYTFVAKEIESYMVKLKTLASVYRWQHGQERTNFSSCFVTFAPRTSLYASFKCLAGTKICLFLTP